MRSHWTGLLEAALYNSVLSGVSLDGKKFFYDNSLASQGLHHRHEWFDVSCCPPNIAHLLTSLEEYIYATNETEIAVHLYIQSTAYLNVGGSAVTLRQETGYPWNGAITLRVELVEPVTFGLKLRLPSWCHQASLRVNGEAFDLAGHVERGYVRVERHWQAGDAAELGLGMPVQRMDAHSSVRQGVRC